MADFTITASNVVPGGTARQSLVAGEVISAGEVLYKKSSDSKAYKAQCDGTTEEATVIGIAINSAAAGQPVSYVESGGSVTVGSALGSAGKALYLSATAGKLMPAADIASTNKLTIVGYSTSATALTVQIINSGTALP